jgi:2'-5' RNA ligase
MAAVRAFFAIVPPPSSLAPLVTAVDRLRGPGASWVGPDRLHVTLAFHGEVSDRAASRLAQRLAVAAARSAPFALRIEGGGAFPRPARPRVLWAGLTGDVSALASLAVAVGAEEPYVPHVTVARVRDHHYDATDALAVLGAVRGEPWTVTEAVLMRSVLGPRPSYDVVARAPLGA